MALAEEHGQQIDGELVEQDRVDALPDDVSRTDADNVIAGDRCGLHHRTLDADGDQGQRRGRREPSSRHVVSNHEDWHAS
jgi:hypothetical protein